jgi:hypothetical protein
MITAYGIIKFLYDLGYLTNRPGHETTISEDDLDKLKLTDEIVRESIREYMLRYNSEMDILSAKHHDGRPAIIDGDVGPAFEELIGLPRCGFPDYLPAGADMQEANWPTACRGKLKFGRSFQGIKGLTAEQVTQAFWASANNWTYALEDVDMVVGAPGDRTGCHRYANAGPISGSTLAWSYLANNSCSSVLQQLYNTNVNWTLIYLATVASHEDGHALGLHHNNDRAALMFPSIHSASQARRGAPNATDLAGMRNLGYKLSGKTCPADKLFLPRPHDVPAPDPDPKDPTDPTVFKSGRIVLDSGVDLGRFMFFPNSGN